MAKKMECCGKNRDTKFCPDCGRSLHQEPIYHLLAHVTRFAHNFKVQSGNNQSGEFAKAKAQKSYEKWAAWEKALRKLIKIKEKIETQK